MGRVLVTRRLTEGGTDPLLHDGHEVIEPEQTPLSPDELIRYAGEVDGIVCHLTDRMDRAVFEAGQAGKLRVVANAAVGYDNIDVPSARDCGISVCNTPGVLDDTTADLAFLLILAAARQSTQAEADLRHGRWTGWGFDTHLARDVNGTTLGLIGYGRIGRAVAQRAAGFDMEVLHTTRHDTGVPGYVGSLHELFAALGHRQPPCTSQRDHSAFDWRTGAGADEANGHPRQHRTRTGCRRERAGGRARGRVPLRGRARRVRRRASDQPSVVECTAGDTSSSHRKCNNRHAHSDGSTGVPGSLRRPSGANTSEPHRSDNSRDIATVPPRR